MYVDDCSSICDWYLKWIKFFLKYLIFLIIVYCIFVDSWFGLIIYKGNEGGILI